MAKIYFQKLHPELCDFIKKPAPAISATPSWWKLGEKHILNESSPFANRENATMRSCPAINDAFNFGYTIFTPIDLFINSKDKDDIFWSASIDSKYLEPQSNIEEPFISFISGENISLYQRSEEYHKIIGKMNTFWGIKTDPGYSIWITNPINNTNLPFKILDSVVDSDKLPTVSPYSFLIKNNFEGIIKAGTPFLQVIPFRRENFVSEITERNIQEEKNIFFKLNSTFSNSYKKYFWTRKKFE